MIFIPCWSVRFWLLLWHFTALFTTPWAVWAWVSASQVGATEERLTVTGKIKMSDLRWRWRTKPCTVILVTRTTERITPVHVPGKQIGKSLLAEAKIWGFGLKFSAFDSTSGFKSFLKISAQNTLPIKRKISRKKIICRSDYRGVIFLHIVSYCPPVLHIPTEAIPGCHCTGELSLGGVPDLSELSPFPEGCCEKRVQLFFKNL